MLATLVSEPFHRNGWVYEEKVDGWRIVAYKDGSRVSLVSRTGRDHAKRFPEIAHAIRRLPASSLILDAEVARFDEQLVSRFHLLHEETGELATPPVFVAFDCMCLPQALDVRAIRGRRAGRWRPLAQERPAASSSFQEPRFIAR